MTEGDVPTQESVDRRLSTIPAEDIARLGDEIYERDIKPQVEGKHDGKVVAIDVDSGCWALGEEALDASDLLQAERPEAVNVWLLRVKYRYLGHLLSPRIKTGG